MRLRLDVLYTYDDRGRILLSNEPIESARRPGPDLAVAISGNWAILRAGANLPKPLADRLDAISADQSESVLTSVEQELEPFGEWTRHGGPAYRFPAVPDFSPDTIEIAIDSRSVLTGHTAWFHDEYDQWGTAFAVVRNGVAVSTCFSSRIDDRSAEAGLWTDPDYRGQGLAVEVTRSWAAAVFASGRIPFYSTSFDNLASQSVARKLGLIEIGEDYSFKRVDRS